MQSGDAHLGHHLEHALGHALAVGGHQVRVIVDVRRVGQGTLGLGVPQRLKGEVGAYRVRPVAHQQAVVMHLPGLAGLDDDADAGALMLGDQMVMHRAHGQQGADGRRLGVHGPVR